LLLFPPGGGKDTAIGRTGRKYWRWLLALQMGLIVIIFFLGREPYKWFTIAFIFSLFATPLSHLDWIIDWLPNPRLRATTLFLVLLLPCISFAIGRQEAYLIKAGYSKLVVDVSRSKRTLKDEATKPVSYLGFIGGCYILFEGKTGQIVLVKQSDNLTLFLIPGK
jgi:hypothetical protein